MRQHAAQYFLYTNTQFMLKSMALRIMGFPTLKHGMCHAYLIRSSHFLTSVTLCGMLIEKMFDDHFSLFLIWHFWSKQKRVQFSGIEICEVIQKYWTNKFRVAGSYRRS